MAKPRASANEIRVKVVDRQLEFLENRAKELGLSSKAELLRWYIVSDMAKSIGERESKGKRRFSLRGITSGSTVTDEDLEEVKKIWESRPLP